VKRVMKSGCGKKGAGRKIKIPFLSKTDWGRNFPSREKEGSGKVDEKEGGKKGNRTKERTKEKTVFFSRACQPENHGRGGKSEAAITNCKTGNGTAGGRERKSAVGPKTSDRENKCTKHERKANKAE